MGVWNFVVVFFFDVFGRVATLGFGLPDDLQSPSQPISTVYGAKTSVHTSKLSHVSLSKANDRV